MMTLVMISEDDAADDLDDDGYEEEYLISSDSSPLLPAHRLCNTGSRL